jgi:cell fate (sporulation/competence/biofilm development) regulator YlbF (YheA/YmcA/DUF963 family)
MPNVIQNNEEIAEDIEAKESFAEFRRIKALLDYVRQPHEQRLLKEIYGSLTVLPTPRARRRS